jgi:hypothetical protein
MGEEAIRRRGMQTRHGLALAVSYLNLGGTANEPGVEWATTRAKQVGSRREERAGRE